VDAGASEQRFSIKEKFRATDSGGAYTLELKGLETSERITLVLRR
jgi:hypothetical protein